ncbi:hypothetical protein [Kitasatospora sp. NPDC059571]|uniref:hypothetical protein n=1 Tax=Kitasatospora sp. NPDC059571 TaxID=3346871 RepID=UPI003678BDD1
MNETSRAGGDEELPEDGTADRGRQDPAREEGGAAPARRPGPGSQAEQDAIFAALVAQFDDPVDLTDPDWPEIENLRSQEQAPGPGPVNSLADFAPRPRPRPRPDTAGQVAGPRDFEVAEDPDEGHFVPPEPPPLPPADTTAKFAWLAVLGGPALLLFDVFFWHEVAGWPAWAGVTAFLGGFVTLVARMKDRDDDEPDDPMGGAVV